ncbi:MAG: hypothetical protein R3E66_04310 [bacterium]
MDNSTKNALCGLILVACGLAPVQVIAEESYEDWATKFDEPVVNHWFELWPFVSVLGGVAAAGDSYGDDTPLYDFWGPMLGARAGLGLPFGFRLAVSLQSLPYIHDDATTLGKYFSATILTARGGVGYWVSSVYVGLQYGLGTGYRVFDDVRIDGETQEWGRAQELSLVVDWHVSHGFFTCEASINALGDSLLFGGLLWGYGWRF